MAILCHNSERWMHHLPIILHGLREDLKASPAELIYGSTLKIPGEFFTQVEIPADSTKDFVSNFREVMQKVLYINGIFLLSL